MMTGNFEHDAIRTLLRMVGDDPARAGLIKTPERVAASLKELCSGYAENPALLFDNCCDDLPDYDGAIALRDIQFYSLCEHHLLPFIGVAHISYIPDQQVYGISRIARLVDVFSRRLQLQERLTTEIADALMTYMQPLSVTVTIEAEHMCLSLRGVQKNGTKLVTTISRQR